MPSFFDDILERADKLHADANLGNISKFPTFSHSGAKNDGALLNFDSGLADIFRHSEEMWKQKRLTKGNETSSLSALKVSRDMSQLRATAPPASGPNIEAKAAPAAVDEFALSASGANIGAYDEYSVREIERYVENSFERARIESERTFFNQQLIDESAMSRGDKDCTKISDPFNELRRGTPISTGSNYNQPLSYEENVFAQKIDIALYNNCKGVIKDALKEAVNEINEKEVTNIWRKAFTVCSQALSEGTENVSQLRFSSKWAQHVIEKSTDFLHECYLEYLENVVENALELANRGGVPGTIPLVEAYLNVKRFSYSAVEDGQYNKHPIWPVLFNCLRVGDLNALAQVSRKLFNVSRCSILIGVLANLHSTKRVDPETKIKLSAEWRQCSSLCQDSFKKAVYGVFLGFDCPDVNGTIEDWLWARLMYCRLHEKDIASSFRQLQNTVCSEFGEEYFVRQGGNFFIYYSALILTGQIEQAVFALFRANLFLHAVHVAILAYQQKLLILTPKISDEILKADVHNPTVCQLNFARIVLRYVKNFELTNINYALNYSFFLNKLELDASIDNKGGRNVFKSCVSRLVYLTGEKDQLLGKMNARGDRSPGLIDKFSPAFSVSEIISYVAEDTNICGDTLEACKLFALAEKPNEAIKLTCRRVSTCISVAAKNRDDQAVAALCEAVGFANWLADIYKSRKDVDLEQHHLSTLFMLIDLNTFFEQISARKFGSALRVIQHLQFIPFTSDEVQACVSSFEMVPEEVRILLPEICTAIMKTIVALHDAETADATSRATFAAHAKSLILYTAMVPYRFPVSTNSILLQLQAKIS